MYLILHKKIDVNYRPAHDAMSFRPLNGEALDYLRLMVYHKSVRLSLRALILLLSLPCGAFAQQEGWIVQWEGVDQVRNLEIPVENRRWLSRPLAIELIEPRQGNTQALHKTLLNTKGVIAFEPDLPVVTRAVPNDPLYPRQANNLSRTRFEEAWDLSPGGTTADGDQIVIAILDAGFDLNHEDLQTALWINPGEIPDDGIDNDGNGYVDDLHGWDLIGNDAQLPDNTHGTQVLGLIGARGDNGRGIAGTNWGSHLMVFSFGSISDVIEAYEYVRYQRELYNRSGGHQGAFVVVTNASFGIEGSTCDQHPIWGAMYDELGRVGVLTAAATANFAWDIDVNGDMPTDCPSDYLIGVANLGEQDLLYRNSGYGREHVDLAAPGEGSYSTLPGSQYGGFGSTSAAAPYVTGAVAMMYAAPCAEFQALVKADPAAAAIFVRDIILSSVSPLPGLATRTASGGQLDVKEAQDMLLASCDGNSTGNFRVLSASPNPASVNVQLQTNTLFFGAGGRVDVYDMLGRRVSTQQPQKIAAAPITLSVDVRQLPAGLYRLHIVERGREDWVTIVVQ